MVWHWPPGEWKKKRNYFSVGFVFCCFEQSKQTWLSNCGWRGGRFWGAMGELRLTLRMEEEVNISIITASSITIHVVIGYSPQSSHLIAHLNLFQGTAAGFSLAPTDELLSVKSLQMKLSTSDNVMITYWNILNRFFKIIQRLLGWMSMHWASGCVWNQ